MSVATFSIHYTQMMNKEGEAIAKLPAFASTPEALIPMYRMMVLVRCFDEKAVKLQRTGKIGTYAGHLGHEALTVGYGSVMTKDDVLIPYYRDYGAQFLRGVTMVDLLRYWGGDERGSNFSHCREDFPISVPIASQALHAIGVAKAFQYRQQKNRVAVTTCGDGGTSEGDFYEALNAAGTWQLPILFIINNNQWAISVPRAQQTHCKTLAQKAIAAGIPAEQVDGNDVIAMRHVCEKALQSIRAGNGPYLIEALTYRLCDHTTADDANRYRSQQEWDNAWQCEPIARFRHFLEKKHGWDKTQEKKLLQECHAAIANAVNDFLQTPTPQIQDMFDHMYASLPETLKQQRQHAIQRGRQHD
jgi:2-oxoisovalerate dehydrogenase E1 component alpha subunit